MSSSIPLPPILPQSGELSFDRWIDRYSHYIDCIFDNIRTYITANICGGDAFVADGSYDWSKLYERLQLYLYSTSRNRYRSYVAPV